LAHHSTHELALVLSPPPRFQCLDPDGIPWVSGCNSEAHIDAQILDRIGRDPNIESEVNCAARVILPEQSEWNPARRSAVGRRVGLSGALEGQYAGGLSQQVTRVPPGQAVAEEVHLSLEEEEDRGRLGLSLLTALTLRGEELPKGPDKLDEGEFGPRRLGRLLGVSAGVHRGMDLAPRRRRHLDVGLALGHEVDHANLQKNGIPGKAISFNDDSPGRGLQQLSGRFSPQEVLHFQ